MLELRTRKREMRGDGTNYHEKLGLRRIFCASQFTILDTAGTSPNPVCNNPDTTSSQPYQASLTPVFSYLLVSSTSFSSSSRSLSLSSTTLPSLHNTKLSHPSQSLYGMIMSWHRVQHTLCTAYTKYRIHSVQHPPRIVCFPFILMIMSWPLDVASDSGVPLYTVDSHQRALHEFKGKLILSHSHRWKLTKWWIESQHLPYHPSTASMFSSNLVPSPPPCVSPN